MTSAWFLGMADAVPQDDSVVREQMDPVRPDGDQAELDHAPEWNEFDSDKSGQLTGLSHRMQAGDTRDSEKFTPWWAGLATSNPNERIDNQVASSGTAAARELAGQQGHGTMQYTMSIEPVIRDGAAMGNDYFVTAPTDIQEGMGNYMTPPDQDNWLQAVAQDRAETASRKAFQATQYQALLG